MKSSNPQKVLESSQVTPAVSQTRSRTSRNSSGNWLSEGRCLSRARSTCRGSKALHTKRYFPYARTPADRRNLFSSLSTQRVPAGSRRGRRKSAADQAGNTDSGTDVWKELVNRTWRIHQVSPLYKFSAKSQSLAVYSRHLSAHVESASTNRLVGIDESANTAKIQLLKTPNQTSSGNMEGIEIALFQKPKNGKGAARAVLLAVLCLVSSRSRANTSLDGIDSAFTFMPLMLVRGPVKLSSILASWLQTQFDCCISPVRLSPIDLSWMVAMFSGFAPEVRAKPVEFVYKLPEEVSELSRITYTIDAQNCQRLWNSIHGSGSADDTFNSDEVVSFVKALEQHFYFFFKVKLSAMQLVRIGTSVVLISNEGSFKIYSEGHVLQVLAHLDEVVQHRISDADN